jgi:putative inorganic carbon (hco3(-)) transporter
MSARVELLDRDGPPIGWIALAAGSAFALAFATMISVQLAMMLVLAAVAALAVALSPAMILPLLVATVFVETFNVGGVRITRLIAPLALLAVLAIASRTTAGIRPAPPLVWALAYGLWALLSGLWTASVPGTIFLELSLAISLVYMLAFALILNTKRQLVQVLYVIAFSSFVVGVFSVLAFLGKGPFNATLQEGRVQGTTGDPSFFAAMQLIALPLILVLAAEERRFWWRGALFIAAVVNIASVFSTVSRGGFLQLLAVVVLLIVLPARSMFGTRGRKAAALLVVVVGGVVFFARYSPEIAPRLETILNHGGSGKKDTGSGRLLIWPAAWTAFEDHPVGGIGYGAFLDTSIDRMYETENTTIGTFKVHPEQVHNTFLGALAEIGIVGFALLVGLLVATILQLRRVAAKAREAGDTLVNGVATALLIGMTAWCIGAFFISAETSRPLWWVIGLSLALPKLISAPAASAAGERAETGRPLVASTGRSNGSG